MKRLKAPELKIPRALQDLFYDLRDRRLLPLLALVVVAIIAVPFLLSNSGSASPSAPLPPRAPIAVRSTGGSRFTVVQSQPGLRQPRKRFGYLARKDPFAEKFAALAPKSSAGSGSKTATTQTATTTTTTTATSATEGGGGSVTHAPSTSSPPAQSPSTGTTNHEIIYFAFAVDVKISWPESGAAKKGEPIFMRGVEAPATLPNQKTQVVAYMGAGAKGKNPLFLVSNEVTGEFGEGRCRLAVANSCQLIELKPEVPETFVYGPTGTRYKIEVLKVERVVSGHS